MHDGLQVIWITLLNRGNAGRDFRLWSSQMRNGGGRAHFCRGEGGPLMCARQAAMIWASSEVSPRMTAESRGEMAHRWILRAVVGQNLFLSLINCDFARENASFYRVEVLGYRETREEQTCFRLDESPFQFLSFVWLQHWETSAIQPRLKQCFWVNFIIGSNPLIARLWHTQSHHADRDLGAAARLRQMG